MMGKVRVEGVWLMFSQCLTLSMQIPSMLGEQYQVHVKDVKVNVTMSKEH